MSDIEKQVKNAINDTFSEILKEAYVTEPKKFDLRTELLSPKLKAARQKDFEGFVSSLNKISAQLDGADREGANDKSSDFRRLKIDEVHNMNAAFLRALLPLVNAKTTPSTSISGNSCNAVIAVEPKSVP